jgi:type VI secretion system protein ImpE
MDPRELIKAGRLGEARSLLLDQVRTKPSDTRPRTVFFQLLAYLGEWQKSLQHLEVIEALNPQGEATTQVYQSLIAAERERIEVLAWHTSPSFLSQPPPYLAAWLRMGQNMTHGKSAEAADSFAEVVSHITPVSGTHNGVEFTGFQDADSFLSPFLELFVHDRYVLAPVDSLREISVSPPKTLLDLLWAPVQIMTWEGLATNCYLPVLYPGTAASSNDQVRLGNLTEWSDRGNDLFRGIGQHVFVVGEEEKGLLELQDVTFNAPAMGVPQ